MRFQAYQLVRPIISTTCFLWSKLPFAFFFILGLVTTALLIQSLLQPVSELPAFGRDQKIALFEKLNGQINTYVFGTSHLHQGFVPSVFDAAFADSPYDLHSLNLAIYGGSQVEQRYMAHRILTQAKAGPGHVCIALLELNIGVNPAPENLLHPRAITIYDTSAWRFATQFSGPDISLVSRVGRAAMASISTLAHYINLGFLSSAIARHLPPIENKEDLGFDDARGYNTKGMTPAEFEALAQSAKTLPTGATEAPQTLAPGSVKVISDIAAPAGTQFFYIVNPALTDLGVTPIYPQEIITSAGIVPIINMAQPKRFPELYQIDNWRSEDHLRTEGAPVFTRLLAHEIRAWLDTHPNAGKCGE